MGEISVTILIADGYNFKEVEQALTKAGLQVEDRFPKIGALVGTISEDAWTTIASINGVTIDTERFNQLDD